MPVTLICPNLACGQTVVVPDSARGKIVRCAHCQQPFMVPVRNEGAMPASTNSAGKKTKKKQRK